MFHVSCNCYALISYVLVSYLYLLQVGYCSSAIHSSSTLLINLCITLRIICMNGVLRTCGTWQRLCGATRNVFLCCSRLRRVEYFILLVFRLS